MEQEVDRRQFRALSGQGTHRPSGPAVDGVATLFAGVYLLSAFAIAPVICIVTNLRGYGALIAVLASMTALLIGYEWRRIGHPMTPAGIIGITGLLVFALRPMTVAVYGTTTAGAKADTRMFSGATLEAANVAMIQVILFYGVLGLAYFGMRARKNAPAPASSSEVTSEVSVRKAGMILGIAITLALLCAATLIQGSGGLTAYLSGLSLRSSFLAGQYFLTLAYIPLSVALVLYVLVRRACPTMKPWNSYASIGAAALLLSCFVTGARGPLLLSGIIPLLLLKQAGPRRFSGRTLLVLGIGLIVAAMVMSLFFRENAFDNGASLRELQESPIRTLLDRLTSGAETRPFDSLILLNEVQLAGEMPWQLGWTYLTVPLWFLPGSLVDAKGGANTWFTSTYLPRYYYPDNIETSISAIGEAFANFGYAGIVVAAAALGYACSRIGLRTQGQNIRPTAVAILLTPIAFSIVRSDTYQTFSVIILTLVCIAVMYRSAIGPKGSTDGPARHAFFAGEGSLIR